MQRQITKNMRIKNLEDQMKNLTQHLRQLQHGIGVIAQEIKELKETKVE